MAPPGRVGQHVAGVRHRFLYPQSASARQPHILILAKLLTGPVNEFIDIAVIVGEQDEALEVLDRRAGIMRQAGQAEIGAQAIKQGQRQAVFRMSEFDPVSQFIADHGKFGRREVAGEVRRVERAQARARINHVGKRDFLLRTANRDVDVIVIGQQVQLFGQVIGEQGRAGDRGGESTGLGQPAKGAGQVRPGFDAGIGDPQFGIAPGAAGAAFSGRKGSVGSEIGDVGTEGGDGFVVNADQFRDGLFCV